MSIGLRWNRTTNKTIGHDRLPSKSTKIFCKKVSLFIINEFRCYEAKIEESEKAGSRRESNPGHLWLEPPVLCH